MKKFVPILLLVLLVLPLALAVNLDVEVIEKNSVVLVEGDKPAEFTLRITNNENITDSFAIFSFVGVTMFPKEDFIIDSNSAIELEVKAAPHFETKRDFKGLYVFEYQIKGRETGLFTGRLTINIVEINDTIKITVDNINLEDSEVTLTIENVEDIELEGVSISVKSRLFEFSDVFDLGPKEKIEVKAPIREDTKGLSAGEYNVEIEFELNEQKSGRTTTVNYLEKGDLALTSEISGVIIRKNTVTKVNEGNINSFAEIRITKDVLSRLFTTFSEKPLEVDRSGLSVEYSWEKDLAPGEKFTVTATTNYAWPLIILIVIILVILIAKMLLSKKVSIQKSVSFVKTKGGEFALKVKVKVRSKKSLEKVRIIDRLPRMTKIYEKYGTKPDKIDKKTRQILWEINKLNAGETRTFTYIIYSKINVIGRFELPAARVAYESSGKKEVIFSNKAYFAQESSEDKEED